MKLASPRYKDKIRREVQTKFGGLHNTVTAADGDLFDMQNLSSDAWPLICPRAKRQEYWLVRNNPPNAFGMYNGMYWASDTTFSYEKAGVTGVWTVDVTDDKKRVAHVNDYLIIMPDRKYMKQYGGYVVSGDLQAYETSTVGGCTFGNGTVFGVAAAANKMTITREAASAVYLKEGDGVTISGCETHPENNTTAVIREITVNGSTVELLFDENTFVLDGASGDTPYTEPKAIRVGRYVPVMDFVFENDNRLWGCRGNTIYASKLGDPFNWNVFEGVATDSWSSPVLSEGDFTGGISYMGYPIFFKENAICKVYGGTPDEFRVMETATIGVEAGSGDSLAVAGNTLFYLSPAGICAYTGGTPRIISNDVIQPGGLKNAVAGSDMKKYYVSGRGADGMWTILVYDTQRGVWHREDGMAVIGWGYYEGVLYFMSSAGYVRTEGDAGKPVYDPHERFVPEQSWTWQAEFGDFTADSPDKKAVSKIEIRAELEGTMTAYIRYDGGDWEQAGQVTAQQKNSVWLPLIPKRADHYRIKITGTGACTIYSIARCYRVGSDKKG